MKSNIDITSKENIESLLNVNRMKNLMYGKTEVNKSNALIIFLTDLYNKYIKNPILNNISLIRKFKKLRDDEKLKKKFESEKKVLIDRIKALNDFDYDYGDSKREFLNNELIDAKSNIIKTDKPCFFEPEMINIHNENLDNPDLKPWGQIMKDESDEINRIFKKQSNVLDNELLKQTNKTKKVSWMPSEYPTNLKDELKTYISNSTSKIAKDLKEE